MPEKMANDHPSKTVKMVRESSDTENRVSKMSNDTSNVAKTISVGPEIQNIDVSDVKMADRKSGDPRGKVEQPEDSELLRKMKMVSYSRIVIDNPSMFGDQHTTYNKTQ